MDVDSEIGDRLAALSTSTNQKERSTSYLTLLESLLSNQSPQATPLITFGRHFTTTSSMAMVVGRQVLSAFVLALCAGSGVSEKVLNYVLADSSIERQKWESLGQNAFKGDRGEEVRGEVVDGVLAGGSGSGWCDDQTIVLRHLQAHLLQKQEDWVGAATALKQIPLEGTSRLIPDEEKLAIYMQIVRLLLEDQEWGSAQTYFNRAASLIDKTNVKETLLSYRLSQARIFDFSAKFNEAAQRYHEISFESVIAEEERLHMLKAAVTTSILAPSGPQRSRVLAALNRDDRVYTSLPNSLSTMLKKMLLEYIVRPQEVKEFEAGLEDHQRAGVEGGGTVLERAVREHNVGACAKVYDNISFDALGAILNLEPSAAELTARRMIEQGRLRAWIDQPLHLLYFETRLNHETDADAQGTAGGLGVDRQEKEIEPVSWTERWDERIRATNIKVEGIASAIQARGLVA